MKIWEPKTPGKHWACYGTPLFYQIFLQIQCCASRQIVGL